MSKIVYELPLNEQIRVLIRLESLLRTFFRYTQNLDQQSVYLALKSLDDILSIMERNNIKKYLGSELSELVVKLASWRNKKNADQAMIDSIVMELQQHKSNIAKGGIVVTKVSDNDFLKHFRQRVNIAGGVSSVDFPRYHFWGQQDLSYIKSKLSSWATTFDQCYTAITTVLKLLRQSADLSTHTAQDGFFQKTLDKTINYKLIRIILPANSPCFAEASGGRYHVTVRMMQDDWDAGVSLYPHDVEFSLEMCRL